MKLTRYRVDTSAFGQPAPTKVERRKSPPQGHRTPTASAPNSALSVDASSARR